VQRLARDVVDVLKITCWGTQSALVIAVLYFSDLEAELELLGFGRNADLMEDQVDAL
jgi:hypothetical protein